MTSESGISILVTRVGRLWAIDPRFLASFEQRVQRGPQAFSDGVRPTQSQRGGTAVLPLYGVLTPRREYFSGTALNEFQGWLNEALRSTAVDRIVIDIDSPGGSVSGVTEAAAAIRKAKAFKPVVAVANSMAASAAYWIASQASEFVATPSGEVGSIGVFAMHQDISKALSQFGVQVTLISAGKYKVEGNPFEPLGDEGACRESAIC